MPSSRQRDVRDFVERWDKGHIDGAEMLAAVRATYPDCTDGELRDVLDAVARGRPSPASACAAAALCRLAGLGDPLATAFELFHAKGRPLTEPQWFAWIAGYSYNWICNGGLDACYFGFGDQQFADRLRVYEAIGAKTAVEILRAADAAFGAGGPAATLSGRQAAISDALDQRLRELSPRFWACGDEIFTCVLLYALQHPGDFRG